MLKDTQEYNQLNPKQIHGMGGKKEGDCYKIDIRSMNQMPCMYSRFDSNKPT